VLTTIFARKFKKEATSERVGGFELKFCFQFFTRTLKTGENEVNKINSLSHKKKQSTNNEEEKTKQTIQKFEIYCIN
jgi:hypothetical protein